MKVKFYCDVWPGTLSLTATTRPSHPKPETAVRLAFEVEIPDDLLTGVDLTLPAVPQLTSIQTSEPPMSVQEYMAKRGFGA